MDVDETVRDYYEALRRGEPLHPYFAEDDDLVKCGVSERLVGYDAVAEALREQTRTTGDWRVESTDLRAVERERHGWFADRVELAWTDLDREVRHEFETRWSGPLARREGQWLFAGMHVSVATAL